MGRKKPSKKEQVLQDLEIERKLQVFEAFQDKYDGKEFLGTVHWFDALSGEGMVRLDDGTSLYCHYAAIKGIDKNGYAYPTADDQKKLERIKGRKVKVTPYVTYGYVGCGRVELIKQEKE